MCCLDLTTKEYVRVIRAGLIEERQMEENEESWFDDDEEQQSYETESEEYWDLLIEA